jgi:hypothetical protein
MVRLVFRPYTQVRRTICTSVSLRASTRVSPGFTLLRHSSPSFGSQQICSYSNLSQANDRSMLPPARGPGSHLSWPSQPSLSLCTRVYHPNTRIYVRLLGPCFKTGQRKPFRQDRELSYENTHAVQRTSSQQDFVFKAKLRSRRRVSCRGESCHTSVSLTVESRNYNNAYCRNSARLPFPRLSPAGLTDPDPSHASGPRPNRPNRPAWLAHRTKRHRLPERETSARHDWFPKLPS